MLDFKQAKLIDLTHALTPEIPQWNMGCGFRSDIVLDYADCKIKTKFRLHKLILSAGIGTHMDAPAHCIPGANTIDAIPLNELFVPCRMIDVSSKADENYQISVDDVNQFEKIHGHIEAGSFIIFRTGWEKHWHHPEKYRNNLIFPSVSGDVAKYLLSKQIVGIGTDTLSPDRSDSDFPVHQLLLEAGKYIIENVANAGQLPPKGANIIALPIKIKEGTEAPIRLIAVIS